MSNITTRPALWQHLCGVWGIQGTRSLIDWIILACMEAWPNEEYLHGYVGPWKYIEEVQQIFREWRIRQSYL